ncbi:alkaline phosphatase-like [Wyeomyia smithii]|uniref:alkaline phosphatase-like n=1 Tax=Wyeomyia smithii TaxID=174621 RepID=UPI0024681F98|nr:alkaline phosphatase-like [Wyeomyia smithii]
MFRLAIIGVMCSLTLVEVSIGLHSEREYHHRKNRLAQSFSSFEIPAQELNSEHWLNLGQQILGEKLNFQHIPTKAKNVIFFIGDGMSSQTIAATRMYLGNENEYLSFEKFPHLGLAKTYCVNRQVPDSSCSGTSYLSGVKINYGMVNLVASIPRYTCEYQKSNETEIDGLMKWAQEAGKGTGIVTTTRVTHATPAASYAHSANRYWEGDFEVDEACPSGEKPLDIAQQMVYNKVSQNFNVILGGGRKYFLPKEMVDEDGESGYRDDRKNLIEEWKEIHSDMGSYSYVWDKPGLKVVDYENTSHLLGLFASSHLLYNLEAHEQNRTDVEPSLAEMTEAAIKMLEKNPSGYVLFVEGGHIDMAHHETWTRLGLDETAELSKAVEVARQLTSMEDTLIIVSADHGHTMTYNGYPKRGQDVLGIADTSDMDGLPYTTLSYANGPGYIDTYKTENRAERVDISEVEFTSIHHIYPATALMDAEAHGGEDVCVYASGPLSNIFIGSYEQHTIPHLIAYAAAIGEYAEPSDPTDDEDGSGHRLMSSLLCLLVAISVGFFNHCHS